MDTRTAVRQVAAFARREKLFRNTRQVLVAVSGGPDSMAALLLLRELRTEFGFELSAIHFDHQLRPESKDDLESVRAWCAGLEVPFLSGEGDVRGVARQQKAGIEETARKMRYQFLSFVAAEKRMDAIVTGHTADDQAETVLMRILRGTGVRGIRGMLPSGGIPGAAAQRLVRPLLVLTRDDTVAICREAGIEPLMDGSNADVAYHRNRLRHEILPLLRTANPSVREALTGLAESARELFETTERASFTAVPKERGPVGSIFTLASLRTLPAEALTLVLEREAAFFHLEFEVNRTRLKDARRVLQSGAGEARFGDVLLQASAGLVRLGPPLAAVTFDAKVLNTPGVTVTGPWRATASTSELAAVPGESLAALDFGAVTGVLRLRPLVPGDRMRYHGIERKAVDVLANAKLPAWERAGVVAIADSRKVHALLTATHTFEADRTGEDLLWVRVGAAPQPR